MNQYRTFLGRRRIGQGLAFVALMGVCAASGAWAAGSGTAAAGNSALQPPPSSVTVDPPVLATAGRESITQAAVIASDQAEFDAQRSDYERALHKLQFNFAQARHQLLHRQLDKLLDRMALQKEAQARHLSTDAVLAQVEVPVVTDAQVRAFYDANKARTNLTYEQLAPRIRQYLAGRGNDAATRAFYRKLRAKYDIVSDLGPFRVKVSAAGPSRGGSDAPVTVVEFADFQCPFCREAESTLHALLAEYPTQVRVVFRNLPLPKLHPDALIAAKAGVCADRQGKFWPMHDAMYADQDALDASGLEGMAKHLGLDERKFSACLSDASTMKPIDADLEAADRLGLTSTPYFFIDGRPISGSVPLEQFQTVVNEELHRVGSGRHLAASRDESHRLADD